MLMAQNRTVTGTVTSAEDGEPVIGASVVVVGTNIGTVTDIDVKAVGDAHLTLVALSGKINIEAGVTHIDASLIAGGGEDDSGIRCPFLALCTRGRLSA